VVLFAPPLVLFKNSRPEFEQVFDCSDNLGCEKKEMTVILGYFKPIKEPEDFFFGSTLADLTGLDNIGRGRAGVSHTHHWGLIEPRTFSWSQRELYKKQRIS